MGSRLALFVRSTALEVNVTSLFQGLVLAVLLAEGAVRNAMYADLCIGFFFLRILQSGWF